jgi:hypothetical protein
LNLPREGTPSEGPGDWPLTRVMAEEGGGEGRVGRGGVGPMSALGRRAGLGAVSRESHTGNVVCATLIG